MTITRGALSEIMSHAESTYPEECCGLLIGTAGKRVAQTMRMKNAFSGPKHDRYHIDPLELYKADRITAQRGFYVAGIYHSHPDYAASLSKFDLEHSFPWYSYLVVSVPKGKAGEVKSWLPNRSRTSAREESIETVGDG